MVLLKADICRYHKSYWKKLRRLRRRALRAMMTTMRRRKKKTRCRNRLFRGPLALYGVEEIKAPARDGT